MVCNVAQPETPIRLKVGKIALPFTDARFKLVYIFCFNQLVGSAGDFVVGTEFSLNKGRGSNGIRLSDN